MGAEYFPSWQERNSLVSSTVTAAGMGLAGWKNRDDKEIFNAADMVRHDKSQVKSQGAT